MQRRAFVVSSTLGSVALGFGQLHASTVLTPSASARAATRKILVAGGGFHESFIRWMAALTGKERPRLCFLPTASADRPGGIITWFRNCASLDVQPFVQGSFIASYRQTRAGRKCSSRWMGSSNRAAKR